MSSTYCDGLDVSLNNLQYYDLVLYSGKIDIGMVGKAVYDIYR